jgi:cyclic beta-1,2-glucan synthetase
MVEAEPSTHKASVYEHCCRAIDRSLTRGAHGLPLMGTGDWNDGMNLVGRAGKGESVWLGFFLDGILGQFIPLCESRGDAARAKRYRTYREALRPALDAAWDGGWYRRAYFDDGTPLGSAWEDECRIDVLPQAWAVMSGAVPRQRAAQAMDAVERELLLDPPGMIRLLAPPFDRTPHEPGYIKGYVPGIRENGGQYTHGALWAVRATAELGRRDRAAAWLAMLSPVNQTRDPAHVAVYQVEPYVVVADIYSAPAHRGRGGWTWYTGSAAWMQRVALESVLGCTLEGGRWLRVRPCIPDQWPGFRVVYRLPDRRTVYKIVVENAAGCSEAVRDATLDGAACAIEAGAARIPLAADGGEHQAVVRLGPATAAPVASKK